MKPRRLEALVLAVSSLSLEQKTRMFEILERYYSHVSWDVFLKDLSDKSEVILLRSQQDQIIQGFSTLKFFETQVSGKTERAVFSGDTIIEKEFWGQTALQKAFVSRLMKEKLKAPHRPLYWFLISKGYKTYLLMANNFLNYFPSQNGQSDLQAHRDAFSKTLFGKAYDPSTGLLQFGESAPRLKGEVAPIPSELLESQSKVAFFVSKNPTWQKGTELACVAELDFEMIMGFTLKTVRKTLGLRTQLDRKTRRPQPFLPLPSSCQSLESPQPSHTA